MPKLDLPKRLRPDDLYEPPAPAAANTNEPMKKRLIRGQALSAMPCYRRIHTLSAQGASDKEFDGDAWLPLYV